MHYIELPTTCCEFLVYKSRNIVSYELLLVSFIHLLVSFVLLLVNSGHLLVSFGVLLVNSGHLLVSFGVLLVNSGHLLLVNSARYSGIRCIAREFRRFTREYIFPTTEKKKRHNGTSFF
ncbi:MAG: hypothetical protein ACQEXK_11625 [Bacillota bacterium]